MKSCVKRILDQYTALQLYTGEVVNDPTHTNDAILSGLNNKFIRAYLEFMDFNLGRFVSFNLLSLPKRDATTLPVKTRGRKTYQEHMS